MPGTADEEERISLREAVEGKPTKPKLFHMYHEMMSLVNIALPTVHVQFSTFFLYPQCASAVGRNLDTESLAAFSLGSLSGNLTCISIIIGRLTASETLQPRFLVWRGVGKCDYVSYLGAYFRYLLLTRAETVFENLGQDADAGVMLA